MKKRFNAVQGHTWKLEDMLNEFEQGQVQQSLSSSRSASTDSGYGLRKEFIINESLIE
jgi:hypothetical protein